MSLSESLVKKKSKSDKVSSEISTKEVKQSRKLGLISSPSTDPIDRLAQDRGSPEKETFNSGNGGDEENEDNDSEEPHSSETSEDFLDYAQDQRMELMDRGKLNAAEVEQLVSYVDDKLVEGVPKRVIAKRLMKENGRKMILSFKKYA